MREAGIGKRFEAGCHVDAISEDVIAVDDDVSDIDSNSELNAILRRNGGVAFDHAALDVNGAAYCVDDTDKLDQHAVARGLDDATAVLSNLGVNELLAVRLELAQRTFLVGAHQPTVAGDIAGHDRG